MTRFNLTRSAPPHGPAMASRAPALVAMAVAMVSGQTGASLAKGLFPVVGAAGAAALRVVIAAAILVLVLRPWRRPPARAAWPSLVAYGLSLGLMNLLFYWAIRTVPLGIAVAVEFTGPLGVAVLGSRRPIDFAWIGLAVAGLLVLAPWWRQAHPLDPLGVALALAAGVCWATYIVFGQRAGAAHGPQATVVGMVVATLVVAPIGLMQAGAALFAPRILLTAAGVAILSSIVPYSLEMFALTRMPVRVFGTLMSAGPAVAALIGWLLLRQALTPSQCFAIAAIMIASLGATASLRSEPRRAAALLAAD
jgi:inner membrane transporter RhtA